MGFSCHALFRLRRVRASDSARISQCFQIKVAVRTEGLLSAISQRLFLSEVVAILGVSRRVSSINEEPHEVFYRVHLH